MPTEPKPTESTGTSPTPSESTAIDSNASEPETRTERNGTDTDRVAALERRVTELEAELEAVRGLVDGVEAVDEAVERRASTALAKAEALEKRFAPEEPGLVRERLSDAGDDGRKTDGNERANRHIDGCTDSDPDGRPGRAGSEFRGESGRGGRTSAESADPRGIDDRTQVGGGRTNSAETRTTDEGAAETGAISSVRTSAPNKGTAAGSPGDTEQSLAARLRDAFR